MGTNNLEVDKTEETATEFQGSDKSTGLGNVKTIIADKLHEAAEALGTPVGKRPTLKRRLTLVSQ